MFFLISELDLQEKNMVPQGFNHIIWSNNWEGNIDTEFKMTQNLLGQEPLIVSIFIFKSCQILIDSRPIPTHWIRRKVPKLLDILHTPPKRLSRTATTDELAFCWHKSLLSNDHDISKCLSFRNLSVMISESLDRRNLIRRIMLRLGVYTLNLTSSNWVILQFLSCQPLWPGHRG